MNATIYCAIAAVVFNAAAMLNGMRARKDFPSIDDMSAQNEKARRFVSIQMTTHYLHAARDVATIFACILFIVFGFK